ncbi:MAG: hypothetical protein GIX03_09970 [Candidatus Eremiobacteraeota bacterium]|nr:hypothetical protein [Candidatus Eremiobacteraeota bacterium]
MMQAMDDMSNFKVKAIGSMQQTVTSLTSEVDKAKAYLATQRGSSAPALGDPATEGGIARIM